MSDGKQKEIGGWGIENTVKILFFNNTKHLKLLKTDFDKSQFGR